MLRTARSYSKVSLFADLLRVPFFSLVKYVTGRCVLYCACIFFFSFFNANFMAHVFVLHAFAFYLTIVKHFIQTSVACHVDWLRVCMFVFAYMLNIHSYQSVSSHLFCLSFLSDFFPCSINNHQNVFVKKNTCIFLNQRYIVSRLSEHDNN